MKKISFWSIIFEFLSIFKKVKKILSDFVSLYKTMTLTVIRRWCHDYVDDDIDATMTLTVTITFTVTVTFTVTFTVTLTVTRRWRHDDVDIDGDGDVYVENQFFFFFFNWSGKRSFRVKKICFWSIIFEYFKKLRKYSLIL